VEGENSTSGPQPYQPYEAEGTNSPISNTGSDHSEQDSDHSDSGPLVCRLRKEAKTQKPQKPHTPAENQEAE
jgi:hypothetical protein